MTKQEAYKRGFLMGLECYAWWKDGIQHVGSGSVTLKKAKKEAERSWNYIPPKEED